MKLTEKQIWEQLKKVIDPELGINLVDLGLIYKVELFETDTGQLIKVVMTLTTPGCPLAGTFEFMIKDTLLEMDAWTATTQAEIELTFDPPWVQDMMSEEAKAELGI